ncbi:hypothetical protein E05_51910 (plasmid) [Plautia stali symbiont]|nr:hypothetical protein E05_51910 [Plautia stali symbiont]
MIRLKNNPMFLTDNKNNYIEENSAFFRLLGLPDDYQIIGKSPAQLPLSTVYPKGITSLEAQAMQQQRIIIAVVIHPFSGSTNLQALTLECAPYYDDQGSAAGKFVEFKPLVKFGAEFFFDTPSLQTFTFSCPSTFFTQPQWEVIFLLSINKIIKTMAYNFGITLKGIEQRISTCLQKSGTSSTDELLNFCKSRGWDTYVPPTFMRPKLVVLGSGNVDSNTVTQ